jgi:uncharacterized protein YndB with AHSA1/START domain
VSTEQGTALGIENLRRLAFYLAVVAALGFFGVMLRDMLPYAVTGWYTELGPHRLHDLNFFTLVWLGLLGLAVQLYGPEDRVTAVVVPVLVMGPLAVIALTAGSPIAMLPVIFTVVGLVVAALHPDGRSLLSLDRVSPVDRGLVGLLVVAGGPLLAYAGTELVKQYTLADEHAALVHYGAMALLAVLVLLLGALATVRRRDWRFAAWGAGLLAVYLGASSFAFPQLPSSTGPFWGGLAVAWGLGFVGATEVTRRNASPVRIERHTVIAAPREQVWDVVNDFDRMTDWVTFADELTSLSEGPVGEGTVYRETGGVGPMGGESEWEITDFEPPERQVHVGDLGIMELELTMTFEAVNGGTQFGQTIELEALPRARPLGWLLERLVIVRVMGSGLEETQANLKRLVETEG